MAFPFEIRPLIYRPSQRPSLRLYIFSPLRAIWLSLLSLHWNFIAGLDTPCCITTRPLLRRGSSFFDGNSDGLKKRNQNQRRNGSSIFVGGCDTFRPYKHLQALGSLGQCLRRRQPHFKLYFKNLLTTRRQMAIISKDIIDVPFLCSVFGAVKFFSVLRQTRKIIRTPFSNVRMGFSCYNSDKCRKHFCLCASAQNSWNGISFWWI